MQDHSLNNQATLNPKRRRYWELDFVRGFCVLLMIIDHFFFSSMEILPEVWKFSQREFWGGLNNLATIYWYNYARSIAQYIVVTIFMLVCGISCTLSRSNFLRSMSAAVVAIAISLVTFFLSGFLNTNLAIWFGVIHMYAAAILIYALLSLAFSSLNLLLKIKWVKEKKLLRGLVNWTRRLAPGIIGLVLIILFFSLDWGYFMVRNGVKDTSYLQLMSNVTIEGGDNFKKFFSAIIGIKNGGMRSADYFPLVPYACIVLTGSLIGELVYNSRHRYYAKMLDGKWHRPISFLGRHALLFYILHQITIVAFMFLVGCAYYIFS